MQSTGQFNLYQNASGSTFLVVQWLRLPVSITGGVGLIPGQGTKILHATHSKNKQTTKENTSGDFAEIEKLTMKFILKRIEKVTLKFILNLSRVQSLSHVRLFVTPWTVAHQASLSITNSQSLLKLMPIVSVMPSNHLILCCPLLLYLQSFSATGSFPMSQFFASGG